MNKEFSELQCDHKVIVQFIPEYRRMQEMGFTVDSMLKEFERLEKATLHCANKISEL